MVWNMSENLHYSVFFKELHNDQLIDRQNTEGGGKGGGGCGAAIVSTITNRSPSTITSRLVISLCNWLIFF